MHGPRNHVLPRALLAWLFPQACSLCGEVGAPVDPCQDCGRALEPLLLRAVCPRCATPTGAEHAGIPAPTGDLSGHCPTCLADPPPFDRVVAPWSFAPPLSSLIHRMKYFRSGGCGGPWAASRARAGGTDPAHGARCGNRAAALQTPPPQARIQPRRGTGDHSAARPRPATAKIRTHRPPPLSGPGEGTKRGGTLRERRGCVHGSPVALPDETSSDCRRRADHRGHRVRALVIG